MGTRNNSISWLELREDFEDLFDNPLCGFVIADANGIIDRVNHKIESWVGLSSGELKGKPFAEILSVGGKIYYETHLSPLLRMQGWFDEVAVELLKYKGIRQKVFINAYERRDDKGEAQFIRYSVFKASDRMQFEENLQKEKKFAENKLGHEQDLAALREQFIAVLGHDLRNPLGSILGASEVLSTSTLSERDSKLVGVLIRSGLRMSELIENVMDFARARLGTGITIESKEEYLLPVLNHLVDELRAIHPDRLIETQFSVDDPVHCDSGRISQLVSNLLANALTHGSKDQAVIVAASHKNQLLEIAISNSGTPIPEDFLPHLFHPFTREPHRPSQNGLGLGLYIASEIAKAHGGELNVVSTPEITTFTYKMVTAKG